MHYIFALVCATLLHQTTTKRTIIARSNSTTHLVELGSQLRLSCTTTKPWFFCLWHSPQENKQCAIRITKPKSVCDTDPRVQLQGGKKFCDVEFTVTLSDHGRWMVLVNSAQDFNTTKEYVDIAVVVHSHLKWGLDIHHHQDHKHNPSMGRIRESIFPNNTFHLTSGESVSLGCLATEGYPPPKFTWNGPIRNTTNHMSIDPSIHLVGERNSIMYQARIKDNNKFISCTMVQSLNGITYHTKTISLKLKIVTPHTTELSSEAKVGLVTVFSVLITFMLCTICGFITMSRRCYSSKRQEGLLLPMLRETTDDEIRNWRIRNCDNVYREDSDSIPHDSQVVMEEDKAVVYTANRLITSKDQSRNCLDLQYEDKAVVYTANRPITSKDQSRNCLDLHYLNNMIKHQTDVQYEEESRGNELHKALLKEIKEKQKQKEDIVENVYEEPKIVSGYSQGNSTNKLAFLEELKQVQNKKFNGTSRNNRPVSIKKNKVDSIPKMPSQNTHQAVIEELKEKQKKYRKNELIESKEGYTNGKIQHDLETQVFQQAAPLLSRSASTSDLSSISSSNNLNFESVATINSQPASEPSHLDQDKQRSCSGSFLSRILINPTVFPPAQTLTKSLILLGEDKPHDHPRRRTRTGPSEGSSHSVFACDEGCFDVDHDRSHHQLVAVQTGALIL